MMVYKVLDALVVSFGRLKGWLGLSISLLLCTESSNGKQLRYIGKISVGSCGVLLSSVCTD